MDPIELAKLGCRGGAGAEGFTDAGLQSLLSNSLRGLSAAYSITQDRNRTIEWFCNATVPAFENRTVKELLASGEI